MLRRIDGFDYIPAAASGAALTADHLTAGAWHFFPNTLNGGYAIPAVTTGAFGRGGALTVGYTMGSGGTYANSSILCTFGGTAPASGVVGVRLYRGSGSVSVPLVQIYDAVTGAPQLTVSFDASGVMHLFRGGFGATVLAITPAGTFDEDRWMFLEIKFTIDSTSGSVEVRINTDTVLLYSGNTQATGIAGFDSVMLGSSAASNTYVSYGFDDLYICDQTGSVNNDFLGNMQVLASVPQGAGLSTTFSANGAATNWQAASNTSLNDTTYVSDGTASDYDLYSMQAVVNAPTGAAIQTRLAMRQDDATQIIARVKLSSGGTAVEGGDHYLNQTYTYYFDIWETDPHTSLGWAGSAINAIQIGPKVQSIA